MTSEPQESGEEESKQQSVIDFNSLPEKIIIEIFCHLDTTSFLKACAVCTHWSKVINTHIIFFESWFADDYDEEGEDEASKEATFKNADGTEYTEQQLLLVTQINSFQNIRQYYELLGVRTSNKDIDDPEIKSQYRKLNLMLHPDKNKAPDATKAFQNLKKAYESLYNGGAFDDASSADIKCPGCSVSFKLHKERIQLIQLGRDTCSCVSCKKEFGQIFCSHCFSSWMTLIERSRNGSLVSCSVCMKYFALQFPVALPLPFIPSNKPPAAAPKKKKRKANWWDPKPKKLTQK